jgi:large subunit ribosomal protein L21
LEGEADSKVVFDKIVMLVNGKKSKVGQPYVSGASVEGKILKHDKAKKIIVFKQRPKKGYRKKQGHRQQFTRVMISKIRTSAKKSTKEETAEASAE